MLELPIGAQLGLGLLLLGRNVNISSQPLCGSLELAKTFWANSPGLTVCMTVRILSPEWDGAG